MILGFAKFSGAVALASCIALCGNASTHAAIVVHEVENLAVQDVNLLGINATLRAQGRGTYTFDVDSNNNTNPGGASTLDTDFRGILPAEFGDLGGAPFQLFADPATAELTVTGDGTFLRLESTFSINVFADPASTIVAASFFTTTPSIFESDIIGLQDFTGSVFRDPRIDTNPMADAVPVFIGDSIVPGLPPAGTLVGSSFNRKVSVVPEPSSLLFAGLALGFGVSRRRRQAGC